VGVDGAAVVEGDGTAAAGAPTEADVALCATGVGVGDSALALAGGATYGFSLPMENCLRWPSSASQNTLSCCVTTVCGPTHSSTGVSRYVSTF